VESVCRGLSDRDVATTAWMQELERRRKPKPRAAMGHGRPFAAYPRSADGANEPAMKRSAMQGRMPGAFSFAYFSLRKSTVARRSNSRRLARRANAVSQEK
jgi:hypothetical protein